LIYTALAPYSDAMPTSKLIEVENLHRNFGAVAAVRDLSFSLNSGEVLGFLGPNGAGKSTTMRIITGNLAPTSGQITLGGYDLLREPIAARRLLGYLPDSPPLYRDCSVREFLDFCGRLHGLRGKHLTEAVDRAIDRCGLGDVPRKIIGHLSKGYQQRVGIAQAIVHDPELVILDEPTVGLDPRQIDEIRQLVRELGENHSVILSTHILSEVQAVCSHVQIINQGELVLKSSLADLESTTTGRHFRIRFLTPPEVSALNELAGIDEVLVETDGDFLISFTDQTLGTESVLRKSLELGWGLTELSPPAAHPPSLEQLFLQLTDEAVANESAPNPPEPISQ